MKVVIDGSALGSGRGGDETYTRMLVEGLAEVTPDDGGDTFPLLAKRGVDLPPALQGRSALPVRRLPRWPAPLRYTVAVPRALALEPGRVDLLHSVIHSPLICPTPVALHLPDISFVRHPELFALSARLRLNVLVPLHLRRARVVLTVSEYSRRDLIDAYQLHPDRVWVVPNAVAAPAPSSNPEDRDPGQETLGVRPPFFLYLGNLHPRKNVPRLIEAFVRARRTCPELASHQLVIAGARWWRGGAEERAARAAAPGSVVRLGRVTDAERDELLRAAQALAYPSLFEGFGLPPLEAMAVGTPVVATNASAVPEVVGDAALLVDPLDVDAIAQALVRVGTDAGLRAELRQRGFGRVAMYTPRRTAEAALQAFRRAIEMDKV